MKKSNLSLIIAAVILLIAAFYGSRIYGSQVISLEDYMKTVSDQLPELKSNHNAVLLAENNIRKAQSRYDVNLISSFNGIGQTPNSEGTTTIDYIRGFQGDLAVQSILPGGTMLKTGITYSQMYSGGTTSVTGFAGMQPVTTDLDFTSVSYDPVINVQLNQPLLYNWFGFLDRYTVKDARNKLTIERLKKDLNNDQTLNYYRKLYIKWIEYRELIVQTQKTLDNAIRLEEQTLRQIRDGLAEQDDYLGSHYSVIKYREQLTNLTYELETLLKELALFIDVESYEPDHSVFEKSYLDSKGHKLAYREFDTTGNAALLNLTEDNMALLLKARKNQQLPRLDLFGNLDVKFNIKDRVLDGESETDTSFGDVDFVVGLKFSYPLGGMKARNDVREVELMIKDLSYQYELTKKNYDKQINTLIAYHNTLKEISSLKKEAIGDLEKKLTIERTKYNQGRLELRSLIDTQNRIADERTGEIRMKSGLVSLYYDFETLVK